MTWREPERSPTLSEERTGEWKGSDYTVARQPGNYTLIHFPPTSFKRDTHYPPVTRKRTVDNGAGNRLVAPSIVSGA